ncbi:SLIT and NTRK-like protein 1 [Trichoplax sp. H2]|nr:SLIT and NTRK-like protein 1 [Trichoplax sp. H2]|eukprot:RDD36661.1 SLIT and NTRK-like protein 1 [Trichoplax sp. H2]
MNTGQEILLPLDVAALNNSAMINIQEPGIGHSNQFLYNKVCRPTTCSLWGNSKPKNISKTEDSCYQLPCIKGCACNDVKLNCQNRKMYQFPRKWIVPYQLVMLRSNHFKKFPIDTSILQPWIYAIFEKHCSALKCFNILIRDLYDNLIDCESASQDSLKNLPNLRSLDIGRNPIKTVGKNAFFNLKNLQILKMEDANILSLHKNAFNGLKNLLSL